MLSSPSEMKIMVIFLEMSGLVLMTSFNASNPAVILVYPPPWSCTLFERVLAFFGSNLATSLKVMVNELGCYEVVEFQV